MEKVFFGIAGVALLVAIGLAVVPGESTQRKRPKKSRVKAVSPKSVAKRPKPKTDGLDELQLMRLCASGQTHYCSQVQLGPEAVSTDDTDKEQTARYKMKGRKLEPYTVDEHSLEMAKRTAAIIGRRGQTSSQSIEFYKGIVSSAEKGCRFRDPLACWHRAELAKYAGERTSTKWARKAKVYTGDILKSCTRKNSQICKNARQVAGRMAH